MTIKSFIQRHQLISYFALAYGITWSGIFALLAWRGFQFDAIAVPDILLMLLMMLLGPSAGGLILTGLLEGRTGLDDLWQRVTRWRVGWLHYAMALFTVPVLLIIILAALSLLVDPAFGAGFQIVGIVVGLLAGGLEEIGWTGFATPRLLNRYNAVRAGLLLGLLWAVWHILADFAGNIGAMGAGWPLWFSLFWLLPLSAYRILMTWVYSQTRSLLLAQLMHASYTGWLIVLSPATSFNQSLLWQTIFGAGLWGLAAIIIVFTWKQRRKNNKLAAMGVL